MKSFDPKKVVDVLLGTADLWVQLARNNAKNPTFFVDARRTLLRQRVRVAELTTFMETLDYRDSWGHPSDTAREELVPQLMKVINEAAQRPIDQSPVVTRALLPTPPGTPLPSPLPTPPWHRCRSEPEAAELGGGAVGWNTEAEYGCWNPEGGARVPNPPRV